MEYIYADDYETKHNPLWYHKRHLMQTATGYGGKLVTETMIYYEGRWRRVYCMCYSNSGSCYILVKGKTIFVS